MSRLRATEPVEVDLGPCECPGTPHQEGDKAWLRPRLTAEGGYRAMHVLMTSAQNGEEVTAGALGMVFLVDGLVEWTLLDDAGSPIPTDEEMLRSGALDWDTTLAPIAERAAVLYTESVIAPLRRGRSAPSLPGPMEGSTSPTNGSSTKPPMPSAPSTTPTTPPLPPTGSLTALASST